MPRALEQAPPGAEGRAGWSGHAVTGVWPREGDLLSFVFLKSHFIIPFHLFDKDAFPQHKVQKKCPNFLKMLLSLVTETVLFGFGYFFADLFLIFSRIHGCLP